MTAANVMLVPQIFFWGGGGGEGRLGGDQLNGSKGVREAGTQRDRVGVD